jgi:two-component system, chemotaxis family, chemotaxis protein CheY
LQFDPARLTVLVLDDQFERRAALRATLGQLGVQTIRLAADEAETIERLRAERFDCLILDDGFTPGAVEFISRLRHKTRGHVQEIAILLCVSADNSRVRAARDAGVTEMVAKPVAPEALRVRLEEIVVRPRPFIRAAGYVGPCRRRRRALDWPFPDRRGGPVANENSDAASLPGTARGV